MSLLSPSTPARDNSASWRAEVHGQRQHLQEKLGARLGRWVAVFPDLNRDVSRGQLGQQPVGVGHGSGQPGQGGDDQRVALAGRGQRLSQPRTRAPHPGQALVEVHPVAIGSQYQQSPSLLVGVPVRALVSLFANPGLSVSELGRRVGLSQPAAARMVDSLEADGLVERVPSTVNRRWVTARPTQQGDRLAQQLLRGRNAPLVDTVTKLDESDQQALAELLEKILTQVYDEVGQGQRICRLCDRESCTRSAPCPVGQAERAEEL